DRADGHDLRAEGLGQPGAEELENLRREGQCADEADGERARSEVQRPCDEDRAAGAGAEKLGGHTLGIGCAKRGPENRRIRGHRRQADSSNVSTKPNWPPLRCSDVCSGRRGSRRETARGRDGTRGMAPRAKLAAAEPGGVRDGYVSVTRRRAGLLVSSRTGARRTPFVAGAAPCDADVSLREGRR